MEYVEYKYESVEKMVNHLIKNGKQNKFIERKINNIFYYAFTMKFINTNANYFLGRYKRSTNICFICNKFGPYNYKKYDYGLYCSRHLLSGMTNIISRTECKNKNCKVRPSYGFEFKKGLYCSNHRKENMIDIKHKMCAFAGCETRPSYNFGGTTPLFCLKHKEAEMIDVISKKCKFEGCKKQCSYGFKGERTTFCSDHRKEGMINVTGKNCKIKDCNLRANFNFEGLRPAFCKKHSKEEMVDVRSKKCLTPFCGIIIHSYKYEGYCLRCFVHLFPEKPNARNYKTKEFAVAEYITNKFPDLKWIQDKQSGSSKKRPDLLCDLEEQIIIIEVDENGHNSEEYCACENKRIMEISQDLNHKPIVFIRFNPDKYWSSFKYSSSQSDEGCKTEKIKVGSCWKINKNGVCVVNDQNAWDARLKVLSDSVEYWKKNKTEKTVEQIFLFYDRFV